MRRTIVILSVMLLAASCNFGGNNKTSGGVKFAPKERESKFTDEERAEAIAKKRAELASMDLDIETLVFENNIKLTVLPPAPSGDISMEDAQAAAVKTMQIVAQNGMGGYGNSPAFCLGTVFTQVKRVATGTAPQRMLVQYDVTFVVGNMITGDIYAAYDQDVEGVGASFEDAAHNAITAIHNDRGVQEMLKTASERIMAWYNNNPQDFKATVESFVEKQDYATAYALLTTVPSQAEACFKYAQKRQAEVLEEMKVQKAEVLLTDLRNAIAQAGDQYTPMAAGALKLIPARSAQYKEGKKLYDQYVARVETARRDSIKHEQKVELERLAMEKMKLKFEQEAAMAQANRAFTAPGNASSSSSGIVRTSSSSSSGFTRTSGSSSGGGSKLAQSFKEHPLLWGIGLGALAIGTAGVGLYAALPFTTKLGLALL